MKFPIEPTHNEISFYEQSYLEGTFLYYFMIQYMYNHSLSNKRNRLSIFDEPLLQSNRNYKDMLIFPFQYIQMHDNELG